MKNQLLHVPKYKLSKEGSTTSSINVRLPYSKKLTVNRDQFDQLFSNKSKKYYNRKQAIIEEKEEDIEAKAMVELVQSKKKAFQGYDEQSVVNPFEIKTPQNAEQYQKILEEVSKPG